MEHIVLRADASASIGTGHAMRLLAVAEGARARGWGTTFVLSEGAGVLVPELIRRGHEVVEISVPSGTTEDSVALSKLARERHSRACFIDGYGFSSSFLRHLAKDLPGRVVTVVVDDLAVQELECDLVVNQNYRAEDLFYRAPRARVLRGPQFALLRPEFVAARDASSVKRAPGERKRVLLTFGGADSAGATSLTLQAIAGLPIEALVVVGAAFKGDLPARREANVEVVRGVADITAVMCRVDCAVSAAGTTLWELACLGIPTLAFVVADNQERCAAALGADDLVAYGGWHHERSKDELSAAITAFVADPGRLTRLGERFGRLVDGRGVARVLDAVHEIAATRTMSRS